MDIETLLVNKQYDKAIIQCEYYFSKMLSSLYDREEVIFIKLCCNWCTSSDLVKIWNKMKKNDKIILVSKEPCDYYVVINSTNEKIDPKKTFVFQMEPYMKYNNWGEWGVPDTKKFLKVFTHESHYNNIEWHLSKTYNELINMDIKKEERNCLSTILSRKYNDIGQKKRVDFVKFLEKNNVSIHVYGENKFDYKEYKKSLPYHCKDDGLFPYKYTFNAENNSIPNYFTEKLVDGILAECLVFYWGCPNIEDYIDEKAFVRLTFNFEEDLKTIKKAIEEDLWSKRIPYIRAAKKKILEELQFFSRLETEITDLRKNKKR